MKDEQRQPSVLKDRMILSSFILPPSSLLCFLVISVFAATAAELAKLKPVRRGLLILGRYVVSALACTTLKNNIIAWHLIISDFRLPIPIDYYSSNLRVPTGNRQLEIGNPLVLKSEI
jgi:hypothetical protein